MTSSKEARRLVISLSRARKLDVLASPDILKLTLSGPPPRLVVEEDLGEKDPWGDAMQRLPNMWIRFVLICFWTCQWWSLFVTQRVMLHKSICLLTCPTQMRARTWAAHIPLFYTIELMARWTCYAFQNSASLPP